MEQGRFCPRGFATVCGGTLVLVCSADTASWTAGHGRHGMVVCGAVCVPCGLGASPPIEAPADIIMRAGDNTDGGGDRQDEDHVPVRRMVLYYIVKNIQQL